MIQEPLRIAMVSYYLPSESKMGIGHQVHALANALEARGNRVTVFSSCRAPEGADYETSTIALRGSVRTLQFARRLRLLDWSQFDVLHAHNGDYLMWRPGLPHVRTMHGSSLREAIHIRGLRNRLVMTYYGTCETLATLAADTTVAVSTNTTRWMPWVEQVIPNGVDLRAFSPGEKSERPSVLFVGTFGNRKRGRLLADVFTGQVRTAIPDAELWMVAEDGADSEGVRVLGQVAQSELQELFRRAWVFCLPSTYEGFGIPYIEAMASGTPVVATPNPGAREITNDGRFGVLATDDQLGQELIRLLSSAAARDEIATAGLARAKSFDLSEVTRSYENLYRRMIREHGSTSTPNHAS